jgi:hypothetical protein
VFNKFFYYLLVKISFMRILNLITLSLILLLASCKKEGCTDPTAINYNIHAEKNDGSCEYEASSQLQVITDNIVENTTWTKDKIYVLANRVTVLDGVTLIIEPGTVIKGEAGTGPNATALIIARGGKLMAEGTENEPIIFTSIADGIQQGEIVSPNLDPTLNGLWGGLIILGNAPISATGVSMQIEGIPPSDQNGLYGGTNPLDNSGVLKYISIRHGGANIGEGNEINGLTLGGVGSGTIIENIEIVANQDDGIEWFGGTVDVTDVVILNVGDDAIDTDQGWSGTLNNFIIINPGDEALELDGPEGSSLETHTITNGTIKALNSLGLVDSDPNSRYYLSNIYFNDLSLGQSFDELPNVDSDGFYEINNLEVILPSNTQITDFFLDNSDMFATSVQFNTVGCDLTKLEWSLSFNLGYLSF